MSGAEAVVEVKYVNANLPPLLAILVITAHMYIAVLAQ